MSGMVERIARSACRRDAVRNIAALNTREKMDAHVEALWPVFVEEARSYISLMREPTQDMEIAAIDYCQRQGLKGWDDLLEIWRAMIGATLAEPQERS